MCSVGLVQCHEVPCSSLYLFSRSKVAPQIHSLSISCRVLICCTCHFQNALPPSLFILASFVCKSLQCLISSLTQGAKGGHLFRLTFSVVLWGGRDTAKNIAVVFGGCSQCMDHTGFAPAHSMCFLALHCSNSRVLCRATQYTVQSGPCILCTSQG